MPKEDLSTVIFKKKTYGGIVEEIYSTITNNTRRNQDQIDQLLGVLNNGGTTIDEETGEVTGDGPSLGDAITLTPHIQKYIQLSNDNNEQMIKLATIIQKTLVEKEKPSEEFNGFLTADDIKQISEIADVMKDHAETQSKLELPATSVKIKLR